MSNKEGEMYGLFTKVGAGAVFSAGLSVLGIGMLCSENEPNRHSTPAVATVKADAAIGAQVAVGANPGGTSHGPGSSNPGNSNPGNSNPGRTNPPHQNPPPNCGCGDDGAVGVVAPKLDVDLDVDVDLGPAGVAPAGLIGTVGGVVDGLLPGSDCGCDPHTPAPQPMLGLPGLGLGL